jgi:hypothetical protein
MNQPSACHGVNCRACGQDATEKTARPHPPRCEIEEADGDYPPEEEEAAEMMASASMPAHSSAVMSPSLQAYAV